MYVGKRGRCVCVEIWRQRLDRPEKWAKSPLHGGVHLAQPQSSPHHQKLAGRRLFPRSGALGMGELFAREIVSGGGKVGPGGVPKIMGLGGPA